MKYRIDARYVWYDKGTKIVLMYFIQNIPFTFDDVPDDGLNDLELIKLADGQKSWNPEDLFRTSFYLIDEECHPMLFELDLENPEILPSE